MKKHRQARLRVEELESGPETAAPLALSPGNSILTDGQPRSRGNTERDGVIWPGFDRPAMTSPSAEEIFADGDMNEIIGALALAMAIPMLRVPQLKPKPIKPRRLTDGL